MSLQMQKAELREAERVNKVAWSFAVACLTVAGITVAGRARTEPAQPPLSPWLTEERLCGLDGSVWQNGLIVDASLPCNWGLTDDAASRSATCAGADTLAAIEKQEVDRRNLQVLIS